MKKDDRSASFLRFEKLMKRQGLNMARVAKDAGIPPSTLYEWKKGTYVPKYPKMARIAKVLKVTPEYLQSGVIDRGSIGILSDKPSDGVVVMKKSTQPDSTAVRVSDWVSRNDSNRVLIEEIMGMEQDKVKMAIRIIKALKQ